jgi:uncharacterized membrane protein YfcA
VNVYLPIAEMSVSGEIIILLGAVVGFLSGVFGVGGGFLTTPLLIFMGVPAAIAVGTQANQLVASSFTGVISHMKRSNVDMKIGMIMLGGGAGGSIIGTFVFKLLEKLGQIEFAVSFLYVILLGFIGSMMLLDTVFKAFKKKTVRSEFNTLKQNKFYMMLPYKMRFPKSQLYISALVPMGIGFVGGILASILGIGGGFLIVPAMIYMLGMPTILAAGTALFQIVFTTAFSTVMHATFNHTVDVVLAALLITGSVIGVQFGVAAGRHITGEKARVMMAILILLAGSRLAANLFLQPDELFSTVMR